MITFSLSLHVSLLSLLTPFVWLKHGLHNKEAMDPVVLWWKGIFLKEAGRGTSAWWSCHEERPKRNILLFVFSVIIMRNELLFYFFPMILVLLSNKSVCEVVSPLPDRNLLINLFFNQKIDSLPQNNCLLISRKTSKVLDFIQHRIRAIWNLRDFSEKTISIWRGICSRLTGNSMKSLRGMILGERRRTSEEG